MLRISRFNELIIDLMVNEQEQDREWERESEREKSIKNDLLKRLNQKIKSFRCIYNLLEKSSNTLYTSHFARKITLKCA